MANIGIIGAGVWGRNHVRACYEMKECNILKVSDLNKDLLKEFSKEYGVDTTTDYKDLLNDPEIDAVNICTPASTHFKIVKEALESGKHVLVEKPISLKSEEGNKLVKIAEKNKKVLMVGHIFRFHPAIIKLKEEIKKGTLGKIRFIKSSRVGLMIPKPDCGVIFDYAIHDVDISCFLLDEYPTEINATASGYLKRDFEDIGSLNLKFKSGVMSSIIVSWLFPEKMRFLYVIGDKKSASLDYITQEVCIFDGIIKAKGNKFYMQENRKTILPFEKKEPLKEEIGHFIECIRLNKTPDANGKIGVDMVRIIEAVHESINKKRAVDFKP